LLPDAIFDLKIHKNAFAAGASTPDPDPTARELTALPSSWWGGGSLPPPQNPTPALGAAGLKFSSLGLKEVVNP